MAKKPYQNLSATDYSHLPQMTLTEVRDRVRDGDDLSLEIVQQMPPLPSSRKDVLHLMREFSVKDILVKEGAAAIASLEIPSPSPFPERSDAILALCAAHIAAIRNKSDALLARANAMIPSTIPYYVERVEEERIRHAVVQRLAKIEQQCCLTRIGYEHLFCSAYIRDSFHSDEEYQRMEKNIVAAFARQEETIIALQQHL